MKDKFIYQLWHHRGQCELAHDCTMGWCSKEGESLIFKCERERIGWCVGPQKVNQDFICLLLGKRRYMSPNDAGHQSLRPCYRTRHYGGIGLILRGMWGLHNKLRLCLFVMGKSGGMSCFSMIEQSDIIRATSLPNASQGRRPK